MDKNEFHSPAPDYEREFCSQDRHDKKGRPTLFGKAMTQAERDRRYRIKRALEKLANEALKAGLDPLKIITSSRHNFS